MSGSGSQSLFFISLPDLRNLCCVNLFFPNTFDAGELTNKQMKTCRELVLLYPDIVASPVLGHFGGITVVMTIACYKSGIIQAFAEKHDLQFNPPKRVLPSILQSCLFYSVTAKLAPKWNKAGQYLIAGKDFLSHSGKLNSVVLELNVTETQLCVSVEANTVRISPTVIEDFDFPTPVVKNFLQSNAAVLHTVMPNNWCHILPSMKKGQIISISRRIPHDCPFQSYTDLQKHWNSMYGYQLPSVREEEMIYCSVHFKPIGDKLFTYPLCCIRTQPIQCFPRVDLQGVLRTFISELWEGLEFVCGFPVQMASKPCYYNNELIRPICQCSGALPVNLTTENTSRAVLNQRPSSWTSSNCARPSTSSPANAHFTHSQSQSVFQRPKLVPVFKNKSHIGHVNMMTKTPAEKQQKLEGQKLTAIIRPVPSSSLSSSSSLQCSTPSAIFDQLKRPGPERLTLSISVGQKAINRVAQVLPQQPFVYTQPQRMPEIPSNRGGDVFESKPKRLKQSVQDVEKYAKSNKLSKVNSATLQAWLKSRGFCVRSKDKKEELVSKVMIVIKSET
ncbi:uncharacterized protein C18orf63 isoform X2 [Xyrauchen texanus]|nr:uncharacterized protein C18orf63 isoform X2 [Xyrauchen texanus]XP_051970694.1 uncharacterized protein C18orf63 isoform X2 [Xyrauchen texanus]